MGTLRDLTFDIGFNLFNNDLLTKADNEVDELKTNLTGMKSELTGVTKAADKAGNELNSSMEKGKKASGNLVSTLEDNRGELLGVWTGLTAGVGFAVKAAADFETQMTRVGQVSQASDKELQKLEETAKSLSLDTAFSPKEIAEGQEYLAMAGFSVQENMNALPDVLDLASAAQMKLGKTSDITSDILTGFGMEAEEMTRVVDTLQGTASGANTNVSMLGESMKFVASVAQGLGYDIETMSSALGLMANAGIKGGQAGRYLRTSLNRLAAPTSEAKKTLTNLDIEITDSQDNLLGFTDIVKEFETELSGMSKAQKQAALTTIFGQEAATGFLSIINQGSDDLVNFRTELYNSAGITEKMANEQMAELNGSFKKLWGSVGLAAIEIGEKFVPVIQLGTNLITGLVNVFNMLPDPLQTGIAVTVGLTGVVLGLATAIGFLAGPITTAATALGLYTPAAVAAEGATVGWNLALLANPITGIIAGIIALGVAIWGVVEYWDVITEKTTQFFGWFKSKMEATPDWLQLLIAPITLIPEYWTEIKLGVSNFFSWFKTTLDKTPSWLLAFTAPLLLIPKHFDTIKSVAITAFNTIGDSFVWLGNGIVTLGKLFWNLANMVPDLPQFFTFTKEKGMGFFNWFKGVLQKTPTWLQSIIAPWTLLIEHFDLIKEKGNLVFNWLREKFFSIKDWIGKIDIGQALGKAIETSIDILPYWLKSPAKKILSFIGGESESELKNNTSLRNEVNNVSMPKTNIENDNRAIRQTSRVVRNSQNRVTDNRKVEIKIEGKGKDDKTVAKEVRNEMDIYFKEQAAGAGI